MIKNISQSGAFMQVSSYYPPQIYGNGQSAGEVRYNTSTQQMEVYDGSSWISITQTATVGLSWEAEEAIRWARATMAEEAEFKKLAEESAAVRIALENVKKAQEQLKITAHLAKETA